MQIDWLAPHQHSAMIDLLSEVFGYYTPEQTISRAVVAQHLNNNLLAAGAPMRLLVAAQDDTVHGFAALGFFHSFVEPRAGLSKQCLMKELYVASAHRGLNIGTRLMTHIIDLARHEGCARIDWHIKTSNIAGRRFYERFGARSVDDRLSLRLPIPPTA